MQLRQISTNKFLSIRYREEEIDGNIKFTSFVDEQIMRMHVDIESIKIKLHTRYVDAFTGPDKVNNSMTVATW